MIIDILPPDLARTYDTNNAGGVDINVEIVDVKRLILRALRKSSEYKVFIIEYPPMLSVSKIIMKKNIVINVNKIINIIIRMIFIHLNIANKFINKTLLKIFGKIL